MSDEGRVMSTDAIVEIAAHGVTPRGARRGSGHLADSYWGVVPDSEPEYTIAPSGSNPEGQPLRRGVHVSQHLSFLSDGKAPGDRPRSEPDSGKPTVRDHRGACGTVMQGLVTICHEVGNDRYPGSYRPTHARAVFLSRLNLDGYVVKRLI